MSADSKLNAFTAGQMELKRSENLNGIDKWEIEIDRLKSASHLVGPVSFK